MKKLIPILFILAVTILAAKGDGLKIDPMAIQSVTADSSVKQGVVQGVQWIGPFNGSKSLWGGDSLAYKGIGSLDTVYLPWAADLWARKNVNSSFAGCCSVATVYSYSAISPWDTAYGVYGADFVTDSTALVGRLIPQTTPYIAGGNILQWSATKKIYAKTGHEVPFFVWFKVWMVDTVTASADSCHLDSTKADIYCNFRFLNLGNGIE